MIKRSECRCICHTDAAIMHFAPCCEPDDSTAIKMTVKGNCGQIHTFEEWQKCRACGPVVDHSYFINTWNAAIEAAAKMIDDMGEEARISEYIRELKK